MIYRIISKDNRHVVEAAKLKLSKHQKETGLFLVEGLHLLKMAQENNALKKVFTTKEIPDLDVEQILVSDEIIGKLSSTKSPQGVVAVCRKKAMKPLKSKRVLYLDDISDPGNLGTILRTGLAFGYTDVIISPQSASIYNDRAISASQGALFALNVIEGDVSTLSSLQAQGYQIIATSLRNSIDIREAKFSDHHIVVLGNETRGVQEDIIAKADERVKIAINGIESLNVAVANGIVLYEINRNK